MHAIVLLYIPSLFLYCVLFAFLRVCVCVCVCVFYGPYMLPELNKWNENITQRYYAVQFVDL